MKLKELEKEKTINSTIEKKNINAPFLL